MVKHFAPSFPKHVDEAIRALADRCPNRPSTLADREFVRHQLSPLFTDARGQLHEGQREIGVMRFDDYTR
jgi:hypothetical protein